MKKSAKAILFLQYHHILTAKDMYVQFQGDFLMTGFLGRSDCVFEKENSDF